MPLLEVAKRAGEVEHLKCKPTYIDPHPQQYDNSIKYEDATPEASYA